MSNFTDLSTTSDRLLALLDLVWKSAPKLRGDAARYYAYEIAQAASLGLITSWRGETWGDTWLITAKGLKIRSSAPRKKRRST